jgi:hypothetical protein
MLQSPFRPVLLLLILTLAACAGLPLRRDDPAPAAIQKPPPAAPEPPPPAPPPIRRSRQICGVEVGRVIDLAELGLPEGSRPLGLALTQDTVWLLFEPALLVGLPREVEAPAQVAIPEFGAVEEIDLIPGPAGVTWSALAVDRWDGSVWLVSDKVPGLWRKRPGRRPEAVRLPATPAPRQGGFRDVLAGRDSVWLAPACADRAVWRLAPSGKLLDASFEGTAGNCPAALLERDWSGTVWAFRPDAGALFQLGPDLAWQPAPAPAPPAPVPAGSGGAGSEALRSWFFWGAEPMALTAEGKDGALLVRNVDGKVETSQEDCGEGNALVDVAGDERGWAVLTRRWLRLADHVRE